MNITFIQIIFIYFFFLYSFFSNAQCFFDINDDINENRCLICSSKYYDQYYHDNLKLSYKENKEKVTICIPKTNSTITRKVLVLNRNCSFCNFSNFDSNLMFM